MCICIYCLYSSPLSSRLFPVLSPVSPLAAMSRNTATCRRTTLSFSPSS